MLQRLETPKGFQRLLAGLLAVVLVAALSVHFATYTKLDVINDLRTPLSTTGTLDVSGTVDYGAAQKVLDAVNKERKSLGLSALVMDKELTEAAVQRAAEITVSFSHTRPDGTRCFTVSKKCYGENIAYGYRTADAVFEGWKNSSGHYENMVRDSFKSIGIACFTTDAGTYWVQLFGYGSGSGYSNSASNRQTLTVKLQQGNNDAKSSGDTGNGKVYNPPTMEEAKAGGSLTMKVTWTPTESITTYQFSYCASGSDDWTTVKMSNIKSGKQSTTLYDMPGKGKYSVRIRGVYEENGTTKYTQWSKTKTVKVKK